MNLEHHTRQTFLGKGFPEICRKTIVGIVGLGGGGSHVAQQMAHIGFSNYVLIDPDIAEKSNLNRLIGATQADVDQKIPKTKIAKRLVKRINHKASIKLFHDVWQNCVSELQSCDIIFGCMDGLSNRDQLERLTRRYLIPYIDIGMDVSIEQDDPPRMAGQVFTSMPGYPCMRCLGFFTDEDLSSEGELYGDAGSNPQVVWANGVLASTAVGLAVDILANWTRNPSEIIWLSYDGNLNTLTQHVKLEYFTQKECTHFPLSAVGPASFEQL